MQIIDNRKLGTRYSDLQAGDFFIDEEEPDELYAAIEATTDSNPEILAVSINDPRDIMSASEFEDDNLIIVNIDSITFS